MRSGSVSRKPGARGRGLEGDWGRGSPGPPLLPLPPLPLPPPPLPPRIVQQAGPGAAGPWTAALPGMVSKALLRLVSAVNRKRMKLLLGIALLAYVACECAPLAGGGASFIPGRGDGKARGAAGSARPRGGPAAGSPSPPRQDLRFLFPPFSGGFGPLSPFPLLRQSTRPTWTQPLDHLGPGAETGRPGGGALAPGAVTAGPRAAVAPPSLTDPARGGASPLPQVSPSRRVGLLCTSPRKPAMVPAGDSGPCRVGTPWGHPRSRRGAVLVK